MKTNNCLRIFSQVPMKDANNIQTLFDKKYIIIREQFSNLKSLYPINI